MWGFLSVRDSLLQDPSTFPLFGSTAILFNQLAACSGIFLICFEPFMLFLNLLSICAMKIFYALPDFEAYSAISLVRNRSFA